MEWRVKILGQVRPQTEGVVDKDVWSLIKDTTVCVGED